VQQALRSRIEQKILAATLEVTPFPHLVIENFFADDVYERILEYNPFRENNGVEWLEKSRSIEVSSRTPYYARKQINFHLRQPFDAPPEQQQFWSELSECFLGDDWFPRLIFDKFPEYFRIRFGDIVDDDDFAGMLLRELFLQRHEPGYYIGPHTDVPTRIFTCIFAFAESCGYEEFGTQLLKPKDRMERCWGSDHYAPDRFEVHKVAPYSPNNFLLFFKTRHSFHSVRDVTNDVPNQRYGMQFQLYEPSGGLFKDLSTPDLMNMRRPAERKSLVGRLAAAIRG
jgi:hypothetical protein